MLLDKLQERRGPQQNPQVQLIYDEPRGTKPRVTVITRGGTATGEDRTTQRNITEELGIRKDEEKTQAFDGKKERRIFEEARQEFKRNQGSSYRTQPEVKEYRMAQEFDQSTAHKEGKEVSMLIDFLYTCLKLIQDEKAIQEL
jgi:hypothetical protein